MAANWNLVDIVLNNSFQCPDATLRQGTELCLPGVRSLWSTIKS